MNSATNRKLPPNKPHPDVGHNLEEHEQNYGRAKSPRKSLKRLSPTYRRRHQQWPGLTLRGYSALDLGLFGLSAPPPPLQWNPTYFVGVARPWARYVLRHRMSARLCAYWPVPTVQILRCLVSRSRWALAITRNTVCVLALISPHAAAQAGDLHLWGGHRLLRIPRAKHHPSRLRFLMKCNSVFHVKCEAFDPTSLLSIV